MQIIKPLLICCFVILLIAVFRQRGRAGLRAGYRLAAVGLAIAAIVFVIDPDIPQAMAELVGVSRGTDLILYTLVVVFAVSAMSLYLIQRDTEVRLQMLARRVALSDAVLESGPPGAPPRPETPTAAGERLVPESGEQHADSPTREG